MLSVKIEKGGTEYVESLDRCQSQRKSKQVKYKKKILEKIV